MAAHPLVVSTEEQTTGLRPVRIAAFPRLRALAWHNDILYASRGYTLFRARTQASATIEWETVGQYCPATWRSISSSFRLASRLFRDGFHALITLSSGHLVGAVPHAIVTLAPGETKFYLSHRVRSRHPPLASGGHAK